MSDCGQELCPMWDGDVCPCEVFGLDKDALPSHGIFTSVPRNHPDEESSDV